MYTLAVSIVKNDADAAEVVSESIYRAYSGLDSLKNQAVFKTWILRIVHNTAIELIRKNSKVVNLDEMSDIEDTDKGVSNDVRLALKDAVAQLNQPYRTVVTLFYYDGLSVSQISTITETEGAAVRQQLSRARKMLREILGEDFANE